ncbi:PREDICTED: uncharacterized protein LOC109208760 [Nicotiana attenuata]|uniref:Uncharacterized protein n=1 Tax=Nicotiana attenuata TaxID=49451 RepID=A0A314KQ29_NICAT|nr:PREDICTED: uncharacterized protein LOC109208760 [Nicotiana attenuata]OIT31372.1 hypothetical protein A4A49_17512 [Nicotiana attenuata]
MSLQSHLENPVVCADTVADHDQTLIPDDEQHVKKSPETLLDLPPESFWIPKDSEQDWFDENATIQRMTSMKLGFFGKANHHSKSFSHRSFASLNHHQKPKSTSLFALPQSKKTSSTEGNLKQKKVPKSLFRSRSEPDRKGIRHVREPGSPKVSCIGRVRSKKDRGIRTGFWKKLRNILIRPRAKSVANVETVKPAGSVGVKRLDTSGRSES